jgi:biotin transport system substrate-specific component
MNNAKRIKKSFRAIDLVYIALGAVIICICSWISIPTIVPFTMQTFAVFFVLSALGGKRGTASIILYILLGAIGIPVFSQFTSLVGVLFGPTGGYVIGFILIGLVYGIIVRFFGKNMWVEIIAMLIGLFVCYFFGTVWFMIVYAQANEAVGFSTALCWCVIPFIIPDLIKLRLAVALTRYLSPKLKLQ